MITMDLATFAVAVTCPALMTWVLTWVYMHREEK